MKWLKVAAFAMFLGFTAPAMAQEARGGTVLNVSAEGISEARPDLATITVGVVTQGRTAQAALEENTQRMTRLLETLRREGLAERDIQTDSVSVGQQRRQRLIANYQATNSVRIRVRAIETTGRVLEAIVATGGNRVQRIVLSHQDPLAQLDIARRNAVAEARRRAELYASALGSRVVRTIEVSEPGAVRVGAEQLELTATLTTDELLNDLPQIIPEVPIVPGEVTTRVSVSVSFELR
jgi:uncharacterized protein YggE